MEATVLIWEIVFYMIGALAVSIGIIHISKWYKKHAKNKKRQKEICDFAWSVKTKHIHNMTKEEMLGAAKALCHLPHDLSEEDLTESIKIWVYLHRSKVLGVNFVHFKEDLVPKNISDILKP